MAGSTVVSTAKLSLLGAALTVVCLGQLPPIDSPQYAAKVLTLTGQVSVLRDSQPWALDVGDSIQVKQLIIAGEDGHAIFQVSDGSTFEVFPNSQVVFRKNAPNWKDLIDVLLGRVRIHIEHLGNQPNPNRVLTPAAVISVRGTTFDVSVADDDESTFVEVEDGLVEVQHALLPRGDPKVLSPGDTIRVYKTQPLASSAIDKGTIWKQAMRMVMDAVTTYATRTPRISGVGGGTVSGGGGGVISTGDSGGHTGNTGSTGGIPAPPATGPSLPSSTSTTTTTAPPPPPPVAPPL